MRIRSIMSEFYIFSFVNVALYGYKIRYLYLCSSYLNLSKDTYQSQQNISIIYRLTHFGQKQRKYLIYNER